MAAPFIGVMCAFEGGVSKSRLLFSIGVVDGATLDLINDGLHVVRQRGDLGGKVRWYRCLLVCRHDRCALRFSFW